MIINGKHVVYDGTRSKIDEIIGAMLSNTRSKLMQSVLKTNALMNWIFEGDRRRLEQYYEGTINADLIHDWQREENIYHG